MKHSFVNGSPRAELITKIVFSVILAAGVGFILFYLFLPPLNVQSVGFWVYATAVLFAGLLPFLDVKVDDSQGKKRKANPQVPSVTLNKKLLLPLLVPVAVIIIGLLISSELFNARSYASIIDVEEGDFSTEMPKTDMSEITNIALMDTGSATILGNRTLGSLSEVVSQYTVSPYYTQINYKKSPKKVSNLEYADFFKWFGNRSNGVPGMVMVDPVKSSAEYVKFDEPMYYVESAFFGDDLMRKLRFSYPTKIFDSVSFEVDDEGNPFYIVSCVTPQVMLFGASDVTEIIIFNPCTGEGELMPVENAPSWIDIVYSGYLATDKFNWYGTLSGGFINSIIGNVGCKQATDDFGYIVIEDDVWYFTGVTSVVSDDKSNIGFILTNARTGEYKFFPVIGAEEHSAMGAAEGEVQEKGYVASFPSLVNIAGQATYIMVLKDDVGVVKLYALVNVENYSIVATGATQTEAMNAYSKLLRQSNIDIGIGSETADIVVSDVRIINVSGVSTVYVTASDGNVYKGYLEADERLILVRVGDELTVEYAPGEIDKIYTITSWSFKSEEED